MDRIFVTGLGTGIGKTIVSAIVTEALQADYWKPIQAGTEDITDTERVITLISNKKSIIHPEAFRLKLPVSPHAAAAAEGITIRIKDIKLPLTSNILVIEGAGGVMVPVNDYELMIDLIQQWETYVIVVVKHYLGSINHTLLTLQALQNRNIKAGIVFNGSPNKESERAILNFSNYPVIAEIGGEKEFTRAIISGYASEFLIHLRRVSLIRPAPA